MIEDDHADVHDETPPTDPDGCIRITRLVVWGMYCPNCATRIHRSLVALKGVLEVRADHTVGVVEVVFDSRLTCVPEMINAERRAGGDGRHEFGAVATHIPFSGLPLQTQGWLRRRAQ